MVNITKPDTPAPTQIEVHHAQPMRYANDRFHPVGRDLMPRFLLIALRKIFCASGGDLRYDSQAFWSGSGFQCLSIHLRGRAMSGNSSRVMNRVMRYVERMTSAIVTQWGAMSIPYNTRREDTRKTATLREQYDGLSVLSRLSRY